MGGRVGCKGHKEEMSRGGQGRERRKCKLLPSDLKYMESMGVGYLQNHAVLYMELEHLQIFLAVGGGSQNQSHSAP